MKNKDIIVFGGSGFLGSHISTNLSKKGFNVRIFDKIKSKYLEENQDMIIGDLLSSKDVEKAIAGCDFVMNFAGLSDIETSNNDLLRTINENIIANAILLESCYKNKVKRYVFASSLYVNGKYGGNYRISKQACEEFILNFHNNYGLDYNILRYGSLYGPRSDKRNGIYNFITAALSNKKMIFNGKPNSLREFIHVEDAALSTIKILNNDYINMNLTITGQQSLKIKDLLNLIKEILNDDKIKIDFENNSKNSHYELTPYSYKYNYSKKMYPELSIDLGDGLINIIEEIKKNNNI